MSFYLYSVNLRGNVVPFLKAEFALGDRAVSLHSSAIAVGIILVGLPRDRVEAGPWRRRTLWLGVGGLAGGSHAPFGSTTGGQHRRLLPDGRAGRPGLPGRADRGRAPATLRPCHPAPGFWYHAPMMRRWIGLALLGALSLAAGGARAVETGTVEEGSKLAHEVCVACHAVEPGEDFSSDFGAPTFQQLADTQGLTATALSVALRTPHHEMPDLMLSSQELADVTAYILSLKRP
jgi:mono/diheme cytochrome c family protein